MICFKTEMSIYPYSIKYFLLDCFNKPHFHFLQFVTIGKLKKIHIGNPLLQELFIIHFWKRTGLKSPSSFWNMKLSVSYQILFDKKWIIAYRNKIALIQNCNLSFQTQIFEKVGIQQLKCSQPKQLFFTGVFSE